MRLLGRQNLLLYKDQKLSESEILNEFNKNKELGLLLGAWKSGTLVYDDAGRVQEALESIQNQDPTFMEHQKNKKLKL